MSKRLSMYIAPDVDRIDVDTAVAHAFGLTLLEIGTVVEWRGITTYMDLEVDGDAVRHIVTGATLTRAGLFRVLQPMCAFERPSQFAVSGEGWQ